MRKSILLIVLLLLLGTYRSVAQNTDQVVTLSIKKQSLKEVFRAIQLQTGLNIMVTEKMLADAKKVTLNVKNMPVEQALDLCFKNTDLTYNIVEGTIVVKKKEASELPPQKQTAISEIINLTGTVTDIQGHPLNGVSIIAKGSLYGVTTDADGHFQFGQIYSQATLIFSSVGYQSQEVKINNKSSNLNIKMEPQEGNLENVTISTGYQKIEQKYLTGSVTSIKMDSIYQPGLTTVDKMLEGRVPGLIFMQNSGQAGAAPKLRVRGTSTLLGSQEPLWVVDGIVRTDPVPIPASKINDLDFVNLVGNTISGLNPNDIEQIDVLKDAAATALYGVRAANGVIVITTKRGKPGPPTISYSGSGTYTRRPRYTDKEVNMMNSLERVDVSRELIEKQIPLLGIPEAYEKATMDYYNGVIDYNTYQQQVSRAETMNTDWFKAVTQDVFSSNHTLGISGGSQASRYYASVGYTNEQGVIKGEYNKRYTGHINFDVNYKNFKAQFSVDANANKRRYTPDDLNILNYAYGTSRAIPLYNEDGSLYYYRTYDKTDGNDPFSRPTFNVLNEMNRSGQTVDGNSYTGTANLNYQLMPGLQLNAVLSYTAGNTEQRTWFDEKTNWVDVARSAPGDPQFDLIPFGGELRQQSTRQKLYTLRGQADYSRFIDAGKKHLLNATLGGEINSTKNSDLAQIRRGYYPERGETFANIDLTTYPYYAQWLRDFGQATITEGLTNLAAVYGTATYIYNDRYILSASTRSDFSNAFGTRSNERFLPTWGVSGRWNLDKDLLKNVKWVNLAALRLSYGTQGNMIPNQTPYTIIQKGPLNSYYGAFGATLAFYPNPNLKWEKTDSYNAGFDFSLFNNRINGSVGYFYKRTTNAFLTKRVSAFNGITAYTINAGTVENRGVELAFNFTPINNAAINGGKRGFTWRIDPQLGQVFNKLLSKSIGTDNVLVDINAIGYQDYLNGAVPVNGKAVNTFYAYRFKGLDHTTGQPVFYGAESENSEALIAKYKLLTKEELFKEVMVEAGKREPVIQGGIGNYFGYNNWSLNFMLSYSLGNKIRLLNIASGNYGTYRPTSQQNLRGEFVDRWRYPGDELYTNIPGVAGAGTEDLPRLFNAVATGELIYSFADSYYQMYDNADIRVVSGNYLKLQSADLSYNCSQELCNRLGVKAARLSLAGSNLFTIANKALRGQGPSQSGTASGISLSIRPVYSFNVNLSF